ncbi:MAG: arsenite methyltransferase [Chlorobiaceae bacterium]|nr:arsenite methyltransferase [Chlorobiaceae bacterium]
MDNRSDNGIQDAIREQYASTLKPKSSKGCCSGLSTRNASQMHGYTVQELNSIPEEANLGLGCGNPIALATVNKGDTVLDLGSGAGIDCFLASGLVGSEGRVIGVDMTPEMIERARKNATNNGYNNVEFRLGRIEELPVSDESIDLVTSNCVINLSVDKPAVFREAFRVLKPGGTLMVSDIVLNGELPAHVLESVEAYVLCIAGAIQKKEYLEALGAAGFDGISVIAESHFPTELLLAHPDLKEIIEKMNIPVDELAELAKKVSSLKISATKQAS